MIQPIIFIVILTVFMVFLVFKFARPIWVFIGKDQPKSARIDVVAPFPCETEAISLYSLCKKEASIDQSITGRITGHDRI
jgi:hypothetical protein